MGGQIKFQYSVKVSKGLKNQVKKDVMNAIESDKEIRKEISRVFQMANRRIQNIEKGDLFSPAVAALGKGDIKGYSKFSVKGFGNTGSSWNELKKEYAKAISFLNQPTSSASGAREFEQQVKKQMNVDDSLWKAIRQDVIGGYNSVSSQLLLALPYSDFMQEIYNTSTQSSSRQIETDAAKIANEIQAAINQEAEEVANKVDDIVMKFKITWETKGK